jgi:hypothetical protein
MNDIDFRNTLIKAIELDSHPMADKARILSALLKSNTYIEYTSIFTRREWNTYCAFLHIQVPVESYELIKRNENKILPIAEKIFGRQGDHFLTDIETGIIVVNHDVIDFSGISLTDAISKAIEDAEMFMSDGKYDSAFDRVHTAFHGYLRKKLDDLGESYEESDTLNQLYNKLHTYVSTNIATDQSGLIRTTLRSASGVINSINELRNRHSLAHPNDSIISVREAKLCVKLVKELSDYIEQVV